MGLTRLPKWLRRLIVARVHKRKSFTTTRRRILLTDSPVDVRAPAVRPSLRSIFVRVLPYRCAGQQYSGRVVIVAYYILSGIASDEDSDRYMAMADCSALCHVD